MFRSFSTVAAFVLVAGQATVAFAATTDTPVLIKTSAPSCAKPAKAVRLTQAAPRVNRCESSRSPMNIGTVPLVFAGAAVAGVVAIGIGSSNGAPTSP